MSDSKPLGAGQAAKTAEAVARAKARALPSLADATVEALPSMPRARGSKQVIDVPVFDRGGLRPPMGKGWGSDPRMAVERDADGKRIMTKEQRIVAMKAVLEEIASNPNEISAVRVAAADKLLDREEGKAIQRQVIDARVTQAQETERLVGMLADLSPEARAELKAKLRASGMTLPGEADGPVIDG